MLIQTNYNTCFMKRKISLAKSNVLEVFRAHVIPFQFTSHCFTGFCCWRKPRSSFLFSHLVPLQAIFSAPPSIYRAMSNQPSELSRDRIIKK